MSKCGYICRTVKHFEYIFLSLIRMLYFARQLAFEANIYYLNWKYQLQRLDAPNWVVPGQRWKIMEPRRKNDRVARRWPGCRIHRHPHSPCRGKQSQLGKATHVRIWINFISYPQEDISKQHVIRFGLAFCLGVHLARIHLAVLVVYISFQFPNIGEVLDRTVW